MGSRDRAQPLGREFDEPGPLLERAQQEHAGLGRRHFRNAERLARCGGDACFMFVRVG
jgi:hypothetical protein